MAAAPCYRWCMRRSPRSAALVALVLCAACASTPGRAERIGTRPDGGSIMLSANNDKAWDSARDLMSKHCDGKYRVLAQVQETSAGRGGAPPPTPSAMADPIGPAGAPYGVRVDYECTGGSGPLTPAPPSTPGAPSQVPQTQTPIKN
ncbi:MAG: hypothetical protein RJA59_2013 [Pseudomonadota bacterium]